MTSKRIIFAVMCVLLLVVIVMSAIVIDRVGALAQALLGGTSSDPQSTGRPSDTSQSTPPAQSQPDPPTQPTLPSQPTLPTTQPTDPEHEHSFVIEEIYYASCENYGYSIYCCEDCGKQEIRDMVEPYGHSFGAGRLIEPTCTKSGCTRYTCSRCGEVDDRRYTDPIGHVLQFVQTVTPTCSEAGYDLYRCTHCQGAEEGGEVRQNEVPMTEHIYELVGEEIFATCTGPGYAKYVCLVCGGEAEQVTPPLGHNFSEWYIAADGTYERSCGSCDLLENSADFVWTEQVSVTDEFGKITVVSVGTETEPDLFVFTVFDYLNTTVTCAVDPVQGLVVTYNDADGIPQQIVRHFQDCGRQITIEASQSPDPGPDPTDPQPTDPQPSEPTL